MSELDKIYINNHPYMVHELIHGHIHEMFGFKKWIIKKWKDGLICMMVIPKRVMYPKYFPKLILWNFIHLIHDIFIRFFILNFEGIVYYMRNFFSINVKIVREMIAGK